MTTQPMTLQQVFDKAVIALKRQNKASRDDGGTCFYRHPDDPTVRCAVGHLIADEHYSPDLEGKTVNHNKVQAALEASGINCSRHMILLLDRVQVAHDTTPAFTRYFFTAFSEKMRSVLPVTGVIWNEAAYNIEGE